MSLIASGKNSPKKSSNTIFPMQNNTQTYTTSTQLSIMDELTFSAEVSHVKTQASLNNTEKAKKDLQKVEASHEKDVKALQMQVTALQTAREQAAARAEAERRERTREALEGWKRDLREQRLAFSQSKRDSKAKERAECRLKDTYRNPGPIQYSSDAQYQVNFTLQLNTAQE